MRRAGLMHSHLRLCEFRQSSQCPSRHPGHERFPDRHETPQSPAEAAEGCQPALLRVPRWVLLCPVSSPAPHPAARALAWPAPLLPRDASPPHRVHSLSCAIQVSHTPLTHTRACTHLTHAHTHPMTPQSHVRGVYISVSTPQIFPSIWSRLSGQRPCVCVSLSFWFSVGLEWNEGNRV